MIQTGDCLRVGAGGHDLIHVNESLAGLPFKVDFINFEEVRNGEASKYDVIINCGAEGTAWSGGELWRDTEIVEKLTEYVYDGGVYFGIDEPSAISGYNTFFRMSHVLGVDQDKGDFACHGRWNLPETTIINGLIPQGITIHAAQGVYLSRDDTRVLLQRDAQPLITSREFGKGKGIYLASYQHTPENARLMLNLLLCSCNESLDKECLSSNPVIECAYFPEEKALIAANETALQQKTSVQVCGKTYEIDLQPYELVTVDTER